MPDMTKLCFIVDADVAKKIRQHVDKIAQLGVLIEYYTRKEAAEQQTSALPDGDVIQRTVELDGSPIHGLGEAPAVLTRDADELSAMEPQGHLLYGAMREVVPPVVDALHEPEVQGIDSPLDQESTAADTHRAAQHEVSADSQLISAETGAAQVDPEHAAPVTATDSKAVQESPSLTVTAASSSTVFDAWNEFAAQDRGGADLVMRAALRMFPRELGDMSSAVRAAYSRLSHRDRRRSTRDRAQLLVNLVQAGTAYPVRAGAPLTAEGDRSIMPILDAVLNELESLSAGQNPSSAAAQWVASVRRGAVIPHPAQAERFLRLGISVPRFGYGPSRQAGPSQAGPSRQAPVDPLISYAAIAPELTGLVQRKIIETPEELSAAVYQHLTQFPRGIDGRLDRHAANHFARGASSFFQYNLRSINENAGITVHGVDDDTLSQLMIPYLSNYPELLTYLNRPNLRSREDRNGGMVRQEAVHSGVRVTFHHTLNDPLADRRRRVILRALDTLANASYSLPPTLNVWLPPYHRVLNVRRSTDRRGQPALDIRSTAASATIEDTSRAVFSAPDIMFVSSMMVAEQPPGYTDGEENGVDDLMEDSAFGTMLHEMMHWLNFHNNPSLYADLVSTDFLDDDIEVVGAVSEYSVQNPHEFVAEYGVGRLLGRHYDDPAVAGRAEHLYRHFGGPQPRFAAQPVPAPSLTTEQVNYLVSTVRQEPSLSRTSTREVQLAAAQLPTFDRWRNLTQQAALIVDTLTQHASASAAASSSTVFDAWNEFAAQDRDGADLVMRAALRMFPRELGDMSSAVRAAYSRLSHRDRRRSTRDRAQLLVNLVQAGTAYPVRAGAPLTAEGDRSIMPGEQFPQMETNRSPHTAGTDAIEVGTPEVQPQKLLNTSSHQQTGVHEAPVIRHSEAAEPISDMVVRSDNAGRSDGPRRTAATEEIAVRADSPVFDRPLATEGTIFSAAGIPAEKFRSRFGWAADVNPSGATGPEHSVLFAIALDMALEEILFGRRDNTEHVVNQPPPSEIAPYEHLRRYRDRAPVTVEGASSIISIMQESGPLSRGMVVEVSSRGRINRVINVVNDEGAIVFLDGRSGRQVDAHTLGAVEFLPITDNFPLHLITSELSPAQAGRVLGGPAIESEYTFILPLEGNEADGLSGEVLATGPDGAILTKETEQLPATKEQDLQKSRGEYESIIGASEILAAFADEVRPAIRVWDRPVAEEIKELQKILRSPGSRSLIFGLFADGPVWAVNMLGSITWLTNSLESLLPPDFVKGPVVSIDIDGHGQLTGPVAQKLKETGTTLSEGVKTGFCDLNLGTNIHKILGRQA